MKAQHIYIGCFTLFAIVLIILGTIFIRFNKGPSRADMVKYSQMLTTLSNAYDKYEETHNKKPKDIEDLMVMFPDGYKKTDTKSSSCVTFKDGVQCCIQKYNPNDYQTTEKDKITCGFVSEIMGLLKVVTKIEATKP